MSSGKIYEIWHRRHDYWLLAGIVTYPCSVRLAGRTLVGFSGPQGTHRLQGGPSFISQLLVISQNLDTPWQASVSLCHVLLSSGHLATLCPNPLS